MEIHDSSDEEIYWGPPTLKEVKRSIAKPPRKINRRHSDLGYLVEIPQTKMDSNSVVFNSIEDSNNSIPSQYNTINNETTTTKSEYFTANEETMSGELNKVDEFLEKMVKVIEDDKSPIKSNPLDDSCPDNVPKLLLNDNDYKKIADITKLDNIHMTLVENTVLVSSDDDEDDSSDFEQQPNLSVLLEETDEQIQTIEDDSCDNKAPEEQISRNSSYVMSEIESNNDGDSISLNWCFKNNFTLNENSKVTTDSNNSKNTSTSYRNTTLNNIFENWQYNSNNKSTTEYSVVSSQEPMAKDSLNSVGSSRSDTTENSEFKYLSREGSNEGSRGSKDDFRNVYTEEISRNSWISVESSGGGTTQSEDRYENNRIGDYSNCQYEDLTDSLDNVQNVQENDRRFDGDMTKDSLASTQQSYGCSSKSNGNEENSSHLYEDSFEQNNSQTEISYRFNDTLEEMEMALKAYEQQQKKKQDESSSSSSQTNEQHTHETKENTSCSSTKSSIPQYQGSKYIRKSPQPPSSATKLKSQPTSAKKKLPESTRSKFDYIQSPIARYIKQNTPIIEKYRNTNNNRAQNLPQPNVITPHKDAVSLVGVYIKNSPAPCIRRNWAVKNENVKIPENILEAEESVQADKENDLPFVIYKPAKLKVNSQVDKIKLPSYIQSRIQEGKVVTHERRIENMKMNETAIQEKLLDGDLTYADQESSVNYQAADVSYLVTKQALIK